MAALVIIGFSLWYTNTLVHKIAKDERTKVKLWADAIQRKASLVKYTNDLFKKITNEERGQVELWAQGTRELANPDFNSGDVSFIFEVIKNNQTVPVILTDEKGKIISDRNLDSLKQNDSTYLRKQLAEMRAQHEPIEIAIANGQKNYLYYKDSKLFSQLKNVLDDLIKSFISEVAVNSASVPVIFTDSTKQNLVASGNIDSLKLKNKAFLAKTIGIMSSQHTPIEIDLGEQGKDYIFYQDSFILTQLKYYPYIQFLIIGLFLIIAYTLFSTSRSIEQNQVWVGMSKETAHQLGTPLSSLIAWVEYLKLKNLDDEMLLQVEQDIKRLETITERFSKIGSLPILQVENLVEVTEKAIEYIKTRTSKNVQFILLADHKTPVFAAINVPLFEWVIENLCKNAVDSMNGKGSITVAFDDQEKQVFIDITDTGKGIPKSNFKTVFEPGYTTKKRGWGLGLSLVKRIIENYHSGKIIVKHSEPDKGTTFRITLKK
ncbi:MAG TPA: HAMP domain-containing sensor histidine kinase [Bacteroidia bacterium]|nr:HAMP domain-containing sensor histidine kinase [Bacteroidia bacterium]